MPGHAGIAAAQVLVHLVDRNLEIECSEAMASNGHRRHGVAEQLWEHPGGG